jgi:isomerase DpgB
MLHDPIKPASTGAVRLTLTSPSELSFDLILKIASALDHAEDAGPSAYVEIEIRGADHFVNPALWPGKTDVTTINKWEQLLRRIERMQTLSAVSIKGHCTAEALELLMVADYRCMVSESAVHLSTKGHDVWPGMMLYRLSNQIGYGKARRPILFGGMLTGEQLHQWGVVDTMTTTDAPFDVREWCIATTNPGDLPMRRRLLLDAVDLSYDEAFGAHLAACDRTLKRSEERAATSTHQTDEASFA